VVNLKLSRDGEIKLVSVTLAKNETFTMPLVGRIKNTKPLDLKKLKAEHGVKITQLNDEYAEYWKNNGIEEGCIITAINGVKVNTVDDVKDILKSETASQYLRIELINTNGEKERYNFK
jgi:S1-C subfamily serine protease